MSYKKKSVIISLFGLLFLLGILGIVNASSVAIVSPTTTGLIVTGTSAQLNATFTNSNSLENVTNISWGYRDGSGSGAFTIFHQRNVTATDNTTQVNVTFDSSTIADFADIDFLVNVTTWNLSVISTTISALRLDNNAPSTSSCVITDIGRLLNLDVSASADTADTTVTMNVSFWRPGGSEIAERNTQVNDTSTLMTLSKTVPPGQYTVACQALDELQQGTYATNQTVFVRSEDEAVTVTAIEVSRKLEVTPKARNTIIILLLGFAVSAMWFGFTKMSSGKKRRRR